jgi:hypothetical protein
MINLFVRSWTALLLLTVWAPVAVAAPTPRPAAVIPLEPYLGTLWSLEATVHGQKGRFLFDTGGGVTVVSADETAVVGCKPWGQVTGFRMRGDRIDSKRCDNVEIGLGGLTLTAPTGIVFDFAGILPKDAPPIAGSLALDAFAGRAVTIDLAHRRLIVETPASLRARVAHAAEVPMHIERDAAGLARTPLIAVQTAQGQAWMYLDSGSDGSIVVNRAIAEALGLDPQQKHGQPLHATIAGGPSFDAEKALVQDLIVDGDIGNPLMAKWIITIDLAHERLWLAPA